MQYHLLKLLQIPQIGAQKIARLLAEVDFAKFCQYDKTQLRQIGWNEKQIHRWFHPDEKWIETALNWAERENQRLLTLFDADYPFLLKQISTAPPALFIRGSVVALSLPQVAIVGSRDFSHYGEYWADFFAAELVKNGIAVTSGLAIGIDGFCHQRAVTENGITIAVLGSGLDQVYPTRHRKLADQIIETGGALVSEFFPNQPPIAENFPRRNRIISGLSLGTLVVEAAINSGSLITARYALEQGREVFALPNTAQNPYSAGCHKLIKEGALLTESIEDILQAIAYQLQNEPAQPSLFEGIQAVEKAEKFAVFSPKMTACQGAANSKTSPSSSLQKRGISPSVDLSEVQKKIMAQISLEPISIDDLANACELEVSGLLVEMLNLELLGVVKSVMGGYVMT